jgi:HSP20 family protein
MWTNDLHIFYLTLYLKTFSPKFDVKEAADAYKLYRELLGIEQEDVEIEFTNA